MSASEHIAQILLDQRTVDGHWEGELSASALSTATAVSTFCFYSVASRSANDASSSDAKSNPERIRGLIDSGIAWLVAAQNDDGGWGDDGR